MVIGPPGSRKPKNAAISSREADLHVRPQRATSSRGKIMYECPIRPPGQDLGQHAPNSVRSLRRWRGNARARREHRSRRQRAARAAIAPSTNRRAPAAAWRVCFGQDVTGKEKLTAAGTEVAAIAHLAACAGDGTTAIMASTIEA